MTVTAVYTRAEQVVAMAEIIRDARVIVARAEKIDAVLAAVQKKGPGGVKDKYDKAGREFFGRPGTGSKRWSEQTCARTPGMGNGIIVVRFYIPGVVAIPGILAGDGRKESSTDPGASYRIALAWNTETGEVTYTVEPSELLRPGFDMGGIKLGRLGIPQIEVPHPEWRPSGIEVAARPVEEGTGFMNEHVREPSARANRIDLNRAEVQQDGAAVVDIDYSGLNSAINYMSVDGNIQLRAEPDGKVAVRFKGDDYPSVEAIQYRQGEEPRTIGHDESGGWPNASPLTNDRNHTWTKD